MGPNASVLYDTPPHEATLIYPICEHSSIMLHTTKNHEPRTCAKCGAAGGLGVFRTSGPSRGLRPVCIKCENTRNVAGWSTNNRRVRNKLQTAERGLKEILRAAKMCTLTADEMAAVAPTLAPLLGLA